MPPTAAAAAETAAAFHGCGWFDSSHELQRGLEVIEHASPDEVANELGLGAWLTLQELVANAKRGCAMIPG